MPVGLLGAVAAFPCAGTGNGAMTAPGAAADGTWLLLAVVADGEVGWAGAVAPGCRHADCFWESGTAAAVWGWDRDRDRFESV